MAKYAQSYHFWCLKAFALAREFKKEIYRVIQPLLRARCLSDGPKAPKCLLQELQGWSKVAMYSSSIKIARAFENWSKMLALVVFIIEGYMVVMTLKDKWYLPFIKKLTTVLYYCAQLKHKCVI